MLNSVKSLVLNYSYEPLQFCSAKRAIIMIFNERAEFIESDGYVIRSPTTTFKLPAVIRVLNIVKRSKRRGISFSKKNILRRDNFTCQYCGVSNNSLTVDHVLPKSRGGKSNWINVVVACKPCNLKKAIKRLRKGGCDCSRNHLSQSFIGLFLTFQPVQPLIWKSGENIFLHP